MFEPLFCNLTKANLTQAVKFKILPSVTNYRHKKTSSKIAFGRQVIQNVKLQFEKSGRGLHIIDMMLL